MFLGHRLHATLLLLTLLCFSECLCEKPLLPANGEGVCERESGRKKVEGLEKAVQRLPSNGLLLP